MSQKVFKTQFLRTYLKATAHSEVYAYIATMKSQSTAWKKVSDKSHNRPCC